MDKPLLTLSQVEGWKKRKAELESQIQAAEVELEKISKKLEAADLFIEAGDLPASETANKPDPEGQPQVTLGDRIVRIVTLHSSGLTPSEVRETLRAEGYDMTALDANSSYLYTTLSRLVKRQRLEKLRGKYRVSQKNPSQDGTGAVAAPVRH